MIDAICTSPSFMMSPWTFLVTLLPVAGRAAAIADQVILQAPTTQVEPPCSRFTSYTALGDSYACGYGSQKRLKLCDNEDPLGTPHCTTVSCGANTGAYSYRFWQEFSVPRFQYLACNGVDVLDVLDTQVRDPVTREPYTRFGAPDLVTLNVGGDEQLRPGVSCFAEVVRRCAYAYDARRCDGAIAEGNAAVAALRGKLGVLFDGVRAAAPDARVAVLGYARFWKPDTRCWYAFASPRQLRAMNRLADRLNAQLGNATAGRAGFVFVGVDEDFHGHRFCDAWWPFSGRVWFRALPSWVVSARWEASVFHPKKAGQTAYLAALKEALRC